MRIDTLSYSDQWNTLASGIADKLEADLVLLFGDSETLSPEQPLAQLRKLYPKAQLVGGSSAGNVQNTSVSGAAYVATAVQFEKGSVRTFSIDFQPGDKGEVIGAQLLCQLPEQGLRHLFVLSDGLNMNGSELIRGMNQMHRKLSVTGGMAGDGDRFKHTWVAHNDSVKDRRVAAIGFYGDDLVISYGCFAGWSDFGAQRRVTKSEGNVLYEVDGVPALDFYKKYLGEFAQDLPISGMRFPLSIKQDEEAPEIIRTLLSIDEEAKSITYAGDLPEGCFVRMMQPDIDVLIDGAEKAAQEIERANNNTALGLVVSCAGRKLVMNELVEEELETIGETLGENVQLTGLYSYGEISPFKSAPFECQLHNQTITLTGIYEK